MVQLTEAIVEALGSGPAASREAALLVLQAVAPVLARHVSAILPPLLAVAADPSKEVRDKGNRPPCCALWCASMQRLITASATLGPAPKPCACCASRSLAIGDCDTYELTLRHSKSPKTSSPKP